MKLWIAITAAALLTATAIACEMEEEPQGPPPGLNTPVTVGNLELTVLAVQPYSTRFERANLRVHLRLRKLGGSEYDFSDSSFQIVDTTGTAYDHNKSCKTCPDNVIPGGKGLVLQSAIAAEVSVYFEITDGAYPNRFRFISSSVSSPISVVQLPSGVRPAPSDRKIVQIGSLDIQVIGIETFDSTSYSTFNEENIRLRILIRKVKGDEYDFSLNEWTLVTSEGLGFEYSRFCVNCPNNVEDIILYGDKWIDSNVYFELPRGRHTITEVRYEPFGSTNEGAIPFSSSVTVR